MTTPRERMVRSAAVLIRERGAAPTAIADVLAHSGAPRGSAYHYFPGGRTQLLCEAVDYARDWVAEQMRQAPDSVTLLDGLFDGYRKILSDSDFRAGCPVVAVSVEAGDPGRPDQAAAVIERAAAAFDHWTGLIADRMTADGMSPGRAADLATLLMSSFEGAIVLARAAHDLAPLDTVARQLRGLVQDALDRDAS
ncbi:TetR/AcrR family transcriptional regulator [Mycolicibacterium sp. S2-37]|uniref:TetR/AcrR family transcriptional regulator n=1 Tax=Mycolicibacterium sp. S2-37 TaxID=2810297 RepID=UPI001A94B018|nr:TetR/AcrR family transcriptional regulator [Mycolicibacterium sp. S2-37]MBO0676078.1 TetR/AcrR family transcriptional regulator [Mycolicibacterium sp. S2-37]